ncbi:hypothetical protein J5D25_03510 [Helicobacter pylori]|uniref:hypothetical protein n=1 Tax=Helicobacter pylori TaxID=210 RepID=UPI001AE11BAF|nr:hypothetical protein [Helicobacter pylori]QTO96134.1 hypothetical protein J5D25_03510 [Helicobacter pylori]
MRQEHETAKSFNELRAITQAIMLKKSAQTSDNANISDLTQQTGLKPKASVKAKKGRLNPTKKAFSERQKTAFRDNSQAIANSRRGTKGSYNANAFKTEQANNSSLREKPSEQAFKPGLATHQEKGGSNEA